MTNTKSIQDKVCIVTGAASGIGEATARLLAQQGATVVIADMQEHTAGFIDVLTELELKANE